MRLQILQAFNRSDWLLDAPEYLNKAGRLSGIFPHDVWWLEVRFPQLDVLLPYDIMIVGRCAYFTKLTSYVHGLRNSTTARS